MESDSESSFVSESLSELSQTRPGKEKAFGESVSVSESESERSMGANSKTKVKIAPPSNYMKSTVDPSEYDKTSNLYGRQNSGSTAAHTTQKKRSFKSTKQRI